jgi:hypothetical protein
MSTERAYISSPNVRPYIGQKSYSSKEFATLGNFTARTFAGSNWTGPMPHTSGNPIYRIVPPAGITIPRTGQ